MFNNWFYIIPNLFFGILLILAIKKSKENISLYGKNYLPLFIIALYFLSASLIYFVHPKLWYPYFHESSYTPLNFTIYSLFLFIFLYPSLYLKPLSVNTEIPKTKSLSWLMLIMSLLGIFSFVYQLPYAFQGLLLGAADLRHQMNNEGFFLLPKSPLTTLAVGVSFFYLFYIVFFYIAISQKKSMFIKFGLLIGSLSYIVSGMAFATRDVFVFYGFGFLFVYFYFNNLLSKKIKQNLRWVYLLFTISFIALLLLFSYQRFEKNSSTHDLAYGTIGYFAQQPFVFSETLEMQKKYYEGNLRFPVFISILTEKKKIIRKKPYEWSFGTFIKDFYATGGYTFLIIITLILVPIFYFKLKKIDEKKIFRSIIITLFYFQFMSMGIFYFKFGSKPGNFYILILFIFYITTFFTFNKKKG